MTKTVEKPESGEEGAGAAREPLSPRIARMKQRLFTAPYEICMARALHFTRSYRETEGMDPHLRNALALKRTLENQKIRIEPDEWIAGSKTEKYLAGPLSIERGDFLRSLQFEIHSLHKKKRPFLITPEEKRLFLEEIAPYWDGRTVRDRKVAHWIRDGLIRPVENTLPSLALDVIQGRRLGKFLGRDNLRKIAGPGMFKQIHPAQAADLFRLRHEFAHNNPTPAVFVFDVQGHLSLGVDKVVTFGIEELLGRIAERRERLRREAPGDAEGDAFLRACEISLEAAAAYADRFAAYAAECARGSADATERARFEMIATHCRHVPRRRPRSFHEAMQALWFAHVVGEIQYGTHDVFAPGRCDQYLYPFYAADIEAGRITPETAVELIQEFNLKLTANVEPVPEIGSETNGTLGNSQHCVTIGGLTPDGRDATNELSYLMLRAYEEMKGCINQLSVRVHAGTPREFVTRGAAVFRRASGLAFYGDDAIVPTLLNDGMTEEDARDYCIVGCVETSGQSNTHGCPGGQELTLPAVLVMTLTNGSLPPAGPGQRAGIRSGDPRGMLTWDDFVRAFRRQLAYHIRALARAARGKDRAYIELLPAPYVSALMDDCIENARDITRGGARYNFTSLDARGLATAADSLLAIRRAVYDEKWLTLHELAHVCLDNFRGNENLRRRLIEEIPKFGGDDPAATDMASEIIGWVSEEAARYRNERGGRFRLCFYSYGNHVIDGLFLPATPDGRLEHEPVSNGISPTNGRDARGGPLPVLRAAAALPLNLISSGVSLNMKFHPTVVHSDNGLDAFTDMLRAYFGMGGMHVQPNVVSAETLRDAQRHPNRYRDLIVKVSGYSACFTDLGRSIQDDIISRTEHGL